MAAVAAVCAATMQGGGRLLVAALPDLEPRVNAWLESRDASVHGLWGSWRLLNPIVGAASLNLSGAEFHDVALELDVAESLWRNRIVARRFEVGAARIGLEEGPSGWRLAGTADGAGPDLEAFFLHSDEVRLAARIEFVANEARGAVDLDFSALNLGRAHRWRAALSSDPDCANCYLRLEADVRQTGPGVGDQSGAIRLLAKDFSLRPALAAALSLPTMVLNAAGHWSGDGVTAAARAETARGRNCVARGAGKSDGHGSRCRSARPVPRRRHVPCRHTGDGRNGRRHRLRRGRRRRRDALDRPPGAGGVERAVRLRARHSRDGRALVPRRGRTG